MDIILENETIYDFCQKMWMFLHGGLEFGEGLSLMAEEETGDRKVLYQHMVLEADCGKPLSACVRDSGAFPPYVAGMLEAGEKTGRLEEAMKLIAGYYSSRITMGQKLRTTLIHPAVLLLIMAVLIVVLLTKVLPVFDQIYRQLGSQLSGPAEGMLLLGRGLEKFLPVLCVLACAAAGCFLLFASGTGLRAGVEKLWKQRFGGRGICGTVNRTAAVQVLAMAMGSGLSDWGALQLAEKLFEDVPAVSQSCRTCAEKLENGTSLPKAALQCGLLSKTDAGMLSVGIRSGSGELAIAEIAERMEEECSNALDDFSARVEPAVVLILSVLTGVILITVILPLLQILPALS